MDIDDIEKEFQRIKTCLESGQELLSKKKFAESKKLFEEALSICDRGHSHEHPDRLKCLSGLSEALMGMKEYAAAASTLTELTESTGASGGTSNTQIMLLMKLSYCLEKSGRLKEACASYEGLISLVEAEHGPSDQTLALALERYKAVLSRMSVHGAKIEELESRARSIRKQAYSGEARAGKLLESMEELYGEKQQRTGLRGKQSRMPVFASGGNAAVIVGERLPAAIGVIVLIGLLVALTRPVSQGQFQSPADQFAIAKASCMSGDYTKAGEIFDRLLVQYPKSAACYWYNGGCKVKLADYEGAIKNYTELLFVMPDCEPALVARAGAYLFHAEFDKALSDSDEAVRQNPRDARAYDFRGAAYMRFSRQSDAEKDLQKVTELGGTKHDAYIWEALPDPVFEVPAAAPAGKKGASK